MSDDVAQVQIAVASARESGRPARQHDRPGDGEGEPRILREPPRFRRGKEIGPFGEGGVVLFDISLDCMGGGRRVAQWSACMRSPDRERELVDDSVRDAAAVGYAIERRVLVEAAHVRDPFDRLARAADRERLAIAHDRQRVEIDPRRILPVDRDFGLAGEAALFERREVHEREPDRAFDLVDRRAGEEDDRARGVDALHRLVEAVRPGVGKKAKDLRLRVGDWVFSWVVRRHCAQRSG